MEVRPGFGALCPNCGIVSLNFSKCSRCNMKMTDNVKSIPLNIHQNPPSHSAFPTLKFTGVTRQLVPVPVPVKRQLALTTDLLFLVGNDTPGSAALCHKCGWISFNFSKCRRCNYMFPRHDVQKISDHTGIVLKPQLMSPAEKLAGKTITRPLKPKEGPKNDEVERKRSSSTASMEPSLEISGEPEIVILSSDNEDEQKKKKRRIETQLTTNNMAPVTDPVLKEEPNSYVRNQPPGMEAGGILKEALASTDLYVLISCKTIRIGTFESKPLERVVLSPKGLDMEVLLSGQNVTIFIPMSDISQVMFSLSHTMPVLFVNIYEDGGPKVRKALHMSDSKSFYFDPSSRDETLRRIILFPETLRQDFKMVLKRIGEVSHKCFVEIGSGPAYEILVKSSPCEFENCLAAVCPECGWLSFNFTKCRRCNHILPGNVKTVPSSQHLTRSVQSTNPTQNFTAGKRQLLRPTETLTGKNTTRLLKPTVLPADTKVEKEKGPCTEAPEILILSSDDEDQQEKKPIIEMQPETNISELPKLEISALEKKIFILPYEDKKKLSIEMQPTNNVVQVVHTPMGITHMPYPYVPIICRILQIGTYKVKPLERILFSTRGLDMKLPLPSGQNSTVFIPMSDIIRFMVLLSSHLPVLFISLHALSGAKVREALCMNDPNNKSFYFDPGSTEYALNRITILPEKLTEDFMNSLKEIVEVNHKSLIEISDKLANEMLFKSFKSV